MSYTWTSTNTDGEAQDTHSLSCPVWASSDPTDECTCDPAEDVVSDLKRQIAELWRLQTLGGPPPPFTATWENTRLPGGADPEYRGI